MRKIRVGIVFGGQSVEHEISILSARNVLAALDRSLQRPVTESEEMRADAGAALWW